MTTISAFNVASALEAEALVAPCVAIPSFAQHLVASRPYDGLEPLLDTARAQISTWTAGDVTAALADHPRIGERHSGSGASAAMSHSEQSGVDASDTATTERLAAGNAAYENRFGRIYLVRAAGRTASELLDLLEERLTHDPETELAVTTEQLGEIALLRLEGLFTP